MAQNDQWADFRTGGAPAAPTAPARQDTVIAGPDPYKASSEARANSGEARAQEDQQIQREQFGITQGNTQFNNIGKLRDDFNRVPEVKAYRIAIQQLDQALTTGDGPQNDLALTYAFAKAMDPESVVRDSEQQMQSNSQPWFQAQVERAKKEFGMDGAGTFTPEARAKLRQQIINSVASRRQIYSKQRAYWGELAKRGGFDPFEVVGYDDGETYLPRLQAYDEKRKGKANGVEMRGGLPAGSTPEFGMDGGDDAPFDRAQYVQKTYHINPDQEAMIVAFWNNNRGNANLTADAVKGWYQQNGLPVQSDEDIAKTVADAQKGYAFGGFDVSAAENAYRQQLQGRLDKQGFDPNNPMSAADMAVQGRTFGLMDEAEGVNSAIDALGRGDINNVIPEYLRGRDTTRLAIEQTQQAFPNAAPAAEFVGGLFAGGSAFKGAETAVDLAKAGGKVGALTGYGYGEGLQGSTQNALMGAGGGAVLAPVVGAGTNALAKFAAPQLERLTGRATQAAPDMNVIAAGERQGIPIRQPDAIPELRGKYGEVESSPAGGPKIRDAATQDVAAIENRVAQIGGQGTVAKEAYDTGKAAQKVVERHGKNTKDEAKARYTRAEQLSGDPSVVPENAIGKFDEAISTLSENPKMNAKEIAFLKGVRSDLATKGGKTISQLREIRTNLRTSIKAAGLDNTPAEARAQELLKQTSADIERALADNPEALAQYKKGDQIWAKRADFREQVTRELIGKDGKKSAQETAAALRSMMKNDSDNFSRFLNELTDEEGADLAATLASNLGRNNKGEFSLPIFLTNLDPKNGLVSPRVMKDVFGPDAMKALADLRTISQAKIGTATERNTSRTTSTGEGKMRGLRTALFSLIGMSTGGVAGAVIAPMAENFIAKMGQERAARMLLNPNFTKWLKDAPEATNPKAIDRYIAKLGTLNLAANDNTVFVNAVKEAFTQSPGRVAASTDQKDD